jgi:exopolysaccharide/PEP-CTERM locus tyrosine autokinase
MSLIEQALEKMRAQQQHAGAAVAAARVAAPVVPLAAASAPASDAGVTRPSPPAPATTHSLRISIDQDKLLREGVLAKPAQQHQQASEYRNIKRQLLQALRDGGTSIKDSDRILMIASAIAGEGKTFTAINLALSLARELDYSVLLIDADFAKPNTSRLLGIEAASGLLDAARREDIDPESLVVDTDIPGLSVLPAGSMVANATEYLTSVRMHEILARLVSVPNRIILMDSPPLLMTTESAALAQLAGRVLLVVRAESTPHRAVLDALDLLGDSVNVGLILNQTTHAPLQGYYYGYDYYATQGAASE